MAKKFFLYGENEYTAKSFIKNHFHRYTVVDKSESFREYITQLDQLGLFGSNDVLVFYNVLSDVTDSFETLERTTADWLIWQTSAKGGLRKKERSKWEKIAEFKEFPHFSPYEVKNWLKQQSDAGGLQLSSAVVNQLIELHGNNLYALEQELRKLKSYGANVTPALLLEMSVSSVEEDLFGLLDAVATKDAQKLKQSLKVYLEGLYDEWLLYYMLVKHFRQLHRVKLGVSIQAHPYVQKKIMQQSKVWQIEELHHVLRFLLQIDKETKQGITDLRTELTNFVLSQSVR